MELLVKKKYYLILSFIVINLIVVYDVQASVNYYYADNQKIYLEEMLDKRVYKLKSNKKKEIKVKDKIIKQVYPKSYYYKVDVSEDKDGVVNKQLRTLVPELTIELPFYREIETGEELIVTDDFLVSFRKDLTTEEFKNIVENELNSEIVEPLHYVLDGAGYHLRLKNPLDNVIEISNKCIEYGWCVWAHPNFIRRMQKHGIPNDTYFPQQWHLRNISAEQAWDITKGSSNITIAILDDGFDFDHEEFINTGKIEKKFDLVDNDGDPRLIGSEVSTDFLNNLLKDITGKEPLSHGTPVGGLAAASENGKGVVGVCPNCMLLPIRIAINSKIADLIGELGGIAPEFFIVQDLVSATAISRAVDEGADVINCSWGGGVLSSNLRNAINYAHTKGRNGKGSVIVTSAGNGDQNAAKQGVCRTSSVTAPANYEQVIAVGATDNNDKITCYSSTGPEIDVVAPGGTQNTGILSTDLIGLFGYSPTNIFPTLSLGVLGFDTRWSLQVYDNFSGDIGTFNSWSLNFIDTNNNIHTYTSSTTPPTQLPDGLHPTIPLPSAKLTSPILVSLPLSVYLIKEINFNLDITHPSGVDITAIVTSPNGSTFPFNANTLPNNFPQAAPFNSIRNEWLYMATSEKLPIFEVDSVGDYTNSLAGTSFAAPIVSGLVGLILSANPNLTYKQVDQILKDTADKIDSSFGNYDNQGHSNTYGFGRINAFKAVQEAKDFGGTPVTVPKPTPVPTPTSPGSSSSTGGFGNEGEPNNSPNTAKLFILPASITGNAAISDAGEIGLSSENGQSLVISDLFKFTITQTTTINALLDIQSNSSQDDLDLALFNENGTQILESSSQIGNADELITKSLEPGTYLLGVGAFSGSVSYKLSLTVLGGLSTSGGSSSNLLVTPSQTIISISGVPINTASLAIPITLDTSIVTLGSPTSSVSGTLIVAGSRSEGIGIINTNGSLPSSFTITVPLVGIMAGSSMLSVKNALDMLGGSIINGVSASTNVNSINVSDESSLIINLSTLPKTKRHIFKLLAEGNNFNSSSRCSVNAAVGALKMKVFPKDFNWDSGNHKIIIQVVIPKSLRRFLYKQAGNRVINVEVSCSNGANGLKEVPIQY